jgi:DNA-binding GntR family transcriptional regulator
MGKKADGKPSGKDYRYLTVIQKRYYDFIRAYINKYDIAPSLQEIADNFGVNRSTAHRQVQNLQRSGAIYRSQGVGRSIKPLQLKHREVREYKVGFGGFARNRNFASSGVKTEQGE